VATARDLVEANACERRRLVAAFTFGGQGCPVPEPSRSGRTVLGGLVLAGLLLGGAASAGLLGFRDPNGWTGPGLVVSDETGASYLVLEEGSHPVLHPVLNATSARLALGAGDLTPRILAQETIDDQVIGATIGIPGAPATLPGPARLVQSGWTACAGNGPRLRVRVAESPGVRRLPRGGVVVASRGAHYVVAPAGSGATGVPTAHAYRLPGGSRRAEGDEQDTLLDELGLPIRDEAPRVPAGWLALFPAGGDLAWPSFGLTGFGRRAPGAGSWGVPAGARVGDVLTTDDGSFLLTRRGPAELTDFALAVYRHVTTPRGRLTDGRFRTGRAPLEHAVDDAPRVGRAREPYLAARWPASRVRPVLGRSCAELTAGPGTAPTVRLATDPVGEAGVTPGWGAFVRSGGWGGRAAGPPYVVDATGVAYPLVGREAVDRLGYGDTDAPVVPASWLDLFERGVPLSVEAALSRVRPAGPS
jgi:hypothetical protein